MRELAHVVGSESNRIDYKCHVDFCWRDLLTTIFPVNTAANVACFTQTSVAAIEHVLRGRNGLSGRALINLIRSPVGPRVVDAIAGDLEWRAAERRLHEIAVLEAQLQNLKLKRSELEKAAIEPRR